MGRSTPHVGRGSRSGSPPAAPTSRSAPARPWTSGVAVARTCPETAHRARLRWFKEHHGLLQNSASMVLSAAFETGMGWSEPDALREALVDRPGLARDLRGGGDGGAGPAGGGGRPAQGLLRLVAQVPVRRG
ncbi:MAG: hypothetical protein WDM92_15825 [Caulobacteraceae bacterium]